MFLGEASKGYAVGGWRYIKDPGISKDIAAPKIILEGSNLFIVYIYVCVCALKTDGVFYVEVGDKLRFMETA